MTDLIRVASVWIRRAEGRTHECVSRFAPSFEAASKILREWARTAPDSGGYDKCDFVVTYEDGEQYEGRYDLKRHDSGDIAGHMISFLTFYAGVRCPVHLTEADYRTFLERSTTPERREAFVTFLSTYELRAA